MQGTMFRTQPIELGSKSFPHVDQYAAWWDVLRLPDSFEKSVISNIVY